MISLGGLKEVLSRLASGRDMVMFKEFWEYGVGNCDGLALIGELFKTAAHGFNSQGLTGGIDGTEHWMREFLLPPAASMGFRWMKIRRGVGAITTSKQDHLSPAEISGIKFSIPYNNTIYLNRLLNKLLRNYIDRNHLQPNIRY
jgi:hypothetical protein